MKSIARSAALLIATGMLAFSCRQELDTQKVQPAEIQQELAATQQDEQRIQFAKTLAKALVNEEVRSFIKQEAGKQFDLDYDVLFQLAKDKELSGGRTFSATLAGFAESEAQFAKTTESLPLLTIMVPELKKFSTKTWDVATQIPLVAIVNSNHDEKKHTKLTAFDHEGRQFELASNVEPDVPVVVVKNNERVVVAGKNGRSGGSEAKGSLVAQHGGNSFYFIDDSFNAQKNKAARYVSSTEADPKTVQAFNLAAVSQRDYVYYNILTNTNRGPLNTSYAEWITSIEFVDQTNMNTAIYDEQLGDWSDGAFEFQIDVLFFNGKSGVKNTSFNFSILKSDMLYSDGVTPKPYAFPMPLRITTWDYQNMGDTWQFVVQERDQAEKITVTRQISSKFGTNFSFNASIGKDEKIGIGSGGTSEQSFTLTAQYETTQANDPMGSYLLSFTQPIITNKKSSFGRTLYGINNLNTGTIILNVETRL